MSKKIVFFIMTLCVFAFYGGAIVSAKSEPKQLETEGFCFLNYSEIKLPKFAALTDIRQHTNTAIRWFVVERQRLIFDTF
jgi:hypothetical protein